MNAVLKLSSPATAEFWEIPVLHEDEHLLALNKPSGLAVSPDRLEPTRPSLMNLLHRDIERGAPWASARELRYLTNAHRLDPEAGGVVLLVKTKSALIDLAAQFASEKAAIAFVALVRGAPEQPHFTADLKLAAHPARPGFVRVDPKTGKQSHTDFSVLESFVDYALLECRPRIARPHQVRAHLKHLRLPVVGDALYGGPPLWLSTLKSNYRLKPGHTEKPLIARAALHAEKLTLRHPATQAELAIEAPWPKDLLVAVKYLRRFSPKPG